MALTLRFAARSDVGLLRDGNEDSGYAGPQVLAVADGMGGAAGGEVASSVAIAAFVTLDDGDAQGDLLAPLRDALLRAQDQLGALVEAQPGLEGMGTTLTVMLRSGNRLGLLHVGDSRAYLLRDGSLEQITHDHTLVQSLVDSGRLTSDEARNHPQRNIVTRVLDGANVVEPDLSVRELRLGDRLLLCSDGLSGVVSEDTIAELLGTDADPEAVASDLVGLALRAGGPDNITCVVGDVVDDASSPSTPTAVGAVSLARTTRRLRLPDTPAGRAARLTPTEQPDEPQRPAIRRRRVVWLLAVGMLLVGMVVGAVFGWYTWAQKQYFVGAYPSATGDAVAIYRGPSEPLFGIDLSSVEQTTDITMATLPEFEQQAVASTIPARSLEDADQIVQRLRAEVEACQGKNPPSGCPVMP
ncbi:MAG: protein phosphatase 2C domain-containing protein [Actinomycetes bacterium]